METYAEIEKFCEEALLKGAALNFATFGHVAAQTFVFARRDPEGELLPTVSVVPCVIRAATPARERMAQQHLVNRCEAAAIAIVGECWTTRIDASPGADREESVIVMLEHENGGACSWVMRIDRSGDEPRLLDPVKASGVSFGRLTGYFTKTRRAIPEA